MYPVLVLGVAAVTVWSLVLVVRSRRARPEETIEGFHRMLDALAEADGVGVSEEEPSGDGRKDEAPSAAIWPARTFEPARRLVRAFTREPVRR
jgi:hypothetical protein